MTTGEKVPFYTRHSEEIPLTKFKFALFMCLFLVAVLVLPVCASAGPSLSAYSSVSSSESVINLFTGSVQNEFKSYCGAASCTGTALICYTASSSLPGGICPASGVVGIVDYQTSSIADYGVLKSYASASSFYLSSSVHAFNAQGVASYEDEWTIHGGQPGDPGTAVLDVTITGAFGQSGRGTSYARVMAFDSTNRLIDSSLPLVSPGTYQLSIPMIFDQPFDYKLSLFAVSDLTGIGSAAVDLSHTAQVTALAVFDKGSAVPFDLSTASGSANFANLSGTPEPGSLALLAAGLGLLGWRARRRFSTDREN